MCNVRAHVHVLQRFLAKELLSISISPSSLTSQLRVMNEYIIPVGFVFDGASIPKFLRTFFSPVGVLLMGGLVHDYAYKYACLKRTGKGGLLIVDQKRADEIFRDICIEVNGFYTMNRLAYWSLRLGGFVAWNGHRKRDNKIPGVK